MSLPWAYGRPSGMAVDVVLHGDVVVDTTSEPPFALGCSLSWREPIAAAMSNLSAAESFRRAWDEAIASWCRLLLRRELHLQNRKGRAAAGIKGTADASAPSSTVNATDMVADRTGSAMIAETLARDQMPRSVPF